MVSHDISHQPDVNKVHRLLQSFTQRVDLAVLVPLKIGEDVRPASRKENFSRTSGIFPIQSFVEQRGKVDQRLIVNCLPDPLRYWIACRLNLFRKVVAAEVMASTVQIGHEIQIMCKRPELRRTAKLEFHSFIQIER